MPSGAGLNQVRVVLLDNVTTAATAVTVANGTTQAYGTIGLNDSGGQMMEATGYTKWVFQLISTSSTLPVGYAVTILCSCSPTVQITWTAASHGVASAAYNASRRIAPPQISGLPNGVTLPLATAYQGISNASGFVPGVQPWEWHVMPGPSEQGGTGQIANPMTVASPFFIASFPVDAVRVVLSTIGSAGSIRVVAKAVP